MITTLADATLVQRQVFEFAGMPPGWFRFLGCLLLAALCGAVTWMYRREARVGASARLRGALAAIRCAVLLVLAAVWLQPVIATYIIRTTSARVAVLVDASASMSVSDEGAAPDGAAAPTRLWRVSELLSGDDFAWLRRLAKQNDLALYAFGEQPDALPTPWDRSGVVTSPASAPGIGDNSVASAFPWAREQLSASIQNRTDLGQAIAASLEDAGGSPIAAIIVVSDGNVNKGLSTDDLVSSAHRTKSPFFAIGVGGAQEPPNIRITSITAPTTTPKDDPFEVRVEAAAAGIAPTQVQLELVAVSGGDAPGTNAAPERTVATRNVTLGGDRPPVAELFRVSPTQAGEFQYRARIARLPGEAVASDNLRETSVLVLDEKLRVLLVAGRPSYDYRYLTALLERDKTIEVGCWLQSADTRAVRDGDEKLTELPRRPEEIFAYDAVVLIDPNPADLDSAWAVAVRRLVDEFGGGLLLEAGPHFTSRFLRDVRMQDLVALLPVQPDAEAEIQLTDDRTYHTQMSALEVPADAIGHPLLALSSDEANNRAIWNALPGIYWHLPVQREKPLATVLLKLGAGSQRRALGSGVLMAAQPFGAGRTAFLGFESSWRWRGVGERYFNRFWIQLVRYLTQARRQGASKRGTIVVDRESLNVGEFLKIEARVLDSAFAPWSEAEVHAEIEFADGTSRACALQAIPGREGWFAGRALCDVEGALVVRLSLPAAPERETNSGPRELAKHVRVYRPEIEMRTLRLNGDLLQRLAAETGGRYVSLADAAAVPDWIEKSSEVTVTRGRNVDLWDASWLLVLLAGLLAVEWTLRRRNQLL